MKLPSCASTSIYDHAEEITVQCYASQTGLGTALLQEGQPLADTETWYAQIEKEMLAVVWSLEKFNQYTYGRKVNVVSDHTPLESSGKPLAIRGCALTSWINYMHVAACLYGNKLGQRAPHTRFVVLCHGLFHVICITMPSSCCAIGCTNRWSKVCSVKFYRIPLASDRRSMWVTAIQRKQWTPNDYTRICSDHFCTG